MAALFAATLSTADSLILSCSAAVTRDFVQRPGTFHSLWMAKLVTASVLVLAVAIALTGAESVFALVLDAWGLLGCAFAPLVLVNALNRRVPEPLAIGMIFSGIAAFLIWQEIGWGGAIYAVAPGILVGLTTYLIGSRFIDKKRRAF
jgi:Na+/proline symporter